MPSSRASRVYVGKIPHECRERDLERFFKSYGRIRDILMKNGYGFVEFEDYRDADDAVYELNGKEILGERVTVEHAKGIARRGGGGGGGPPPQRDNYRDRGDRDSRGGDRDSRGGGDRGDRGEQRRPVWLDRYGPPLRTPYQVVVDNLSSRISWQDLKDFMRKAGEVSYADAHRHRKNEGIVEFATHSDMKRALDKLDGTDLMGRRIQMVCQYKKSRSRSRDRRSRSRRSYSTSGSRSRSRSHSRSKSRSRSRNRSRSVSRDRSRSKDRRSASKDRSLSRNKETSRSRSVAKALSRSVSKDRSRSRSRSVSKGKSVSRSPAKSNSRSASGDRQRSASPKKPRSRSASKEQSEHGSPSKEDQPKQRSCSPVVHQSPQATPDKSIKIQDNIETMSSPVQQDAPKEDLEEPRNGHSRSRSPSSGRSRSREVSEHRERSGSRSVSRSPESDKNAPVKRQISQSPVRRSKRLRRGASP